MRDYAANHLVFRQYRLILTPSKETAGYVVTRARLTAGAVKALYPTITGITPNVCVPQMPGSTSLSLWMIGRIDYGHKNNELALTTLKNLLDRDLSATLTIVGDGPDRGRFFAKAEQLKLKSKINFLGWQQDPWSSLPNGAIVLIPSRWEANCLVGIEALLRDIRLVLSPIAAFREVYPDSIVSEESTPEAFADKVIAVSQLNDEKIHLLYQLAKDRYSPARFLRNMLSALDSDN
jgi:glycosyltransferase involved in cell wall biosynthesis